MADWITVEEVFDPSHPFAPYAVNIASSILYKLTGEKFQGVHTVTEQYGMDNLSGGNAVAPAVIGGGIYNLPAGRRGGVNMGGIGGERKLYLRHTPIRSVSSVSVRGTVLPESAYQIRNRAFLVRTNNMGWVFDGLNEITVTYTYGAEPPRMGKEAAKRLANELILAEMGDDRCSLPQRVTSVNRQNMQITLLDPQEFLNEGKTGIYSVDLFIKTYNPDGARKKAKLFVAGRPHAERIN